MMDRQLKRKKRKFLKRKLGPIDAGIDKGPKAKKRKGTKKSRETLEEIVNEVEQENGDQVLTNDESQSEQNGTKSTYISDGNSLEPVTKKKRTSYESVSLPEDVTVPDSKEFKSLEGFVSEKTLNAISDMGFSTMMEIQHKSIVPLLKGRKVAAGNPQPSALSDNPADLGTASEWMK